MYGIKYSLTTMLRLVCLICCVSLFSSYMYPSDTERSEAPESREQLGATVPAANSSPLTAPGRIAGLTTTGLGVGVSMYVWWYLQNRYEVEKESARETFVDYLARWQTEAPEEERQMIYWLLAISGVTTLLGLHDTVRAHHSVAIWCVQSCTGLFTADAD